MNAWDSEFAVGLDTAREVCAGECVLALTDLLLLGEGWDNVVYLVNSSLVFRFPRREAAVGCLPAFAADKRNRGLAEQALASIRTAMSWLEGPG